MPVALPESYLDEDFRERLADWLELSALVDGEVLRTTATDVISDHLDLKGSSLDFGGTLDIPEDAEVLSPDDRSETVVDELWTVVSGRGRLLGQHYPFVCSSDALRANPEALQKHPVYCSLLIEDTGRLLPIRSIPAGASASSWVDYERLFEHVVVASLAKRLGARSLRFGFPPDQGWPTHPRDRIKYLGTLLDLDPKEPPGWVYPTDKDVGLDVVGVQDLGDSFTGGLFVLAQCTVSRNLLEKLGRPPLAFWKDCLNWYSAVVRAISFPWSFLNPKAEYPRWSALFDHAVVLDRARLAVIGADEILDAAIGTEISNWCSDRLSELVRA